MGRTLRILLPCALGLLAALLVSCGDTNKHLIPGDEADAINQNVDAVGAASADGRCNRASSAVDRAEAHVQQLSSSVDPRLRADLEQGLARLRASAATECQENKATSTEEATTSTEETTATTETNTETTNTETQPTETQPTETQPTETQPTETQGGGDQGGGNQGGGGDNSSGGQGAPPSASGGTQAP
jgi:hypothetical protein